MREYLLAFLCLLRRVLWGFLKGVLPVLLLVALYVGVAFSLFYGLGWGVAQAFPHWVPVFHGQPRWLELVNLGSILGFGAGVLLIGVSGLYVSCRDDIRHAKYKGAPDEAS